MSQQSLVHYEMEDMNISGGRTDQLKDLPQ